MMDKKKQSNLIQRSVSGLVFAVVFITMIDLSVQTYNILWLIMGVLSLGEYYILIYNNGDRLGSKKVRNVWTVMGTIYILLAYTLLIFGFNDIYQDWEETKRIFVIMIISLIWSNDIGAYIVGITIGKHKMAPKISPKKSWEGFFGGILFTVGVCILWKIIFWDVITEETWEFKIEWIFFIILAILVSMASVMGDLIESKMKRIMMIKDSGKFLPGHGGVLDRMDSLLLTIPVVSLYLYVYSLIS